MWEGLGLAGPEVPAVVFFLGDDYTYVEDRESWICISRNHDHDGAKNVKTIIFWDCFLFFYIFYFFTALRDWHTQDILKLVPNYLTMTDDTS